VSTLFGDIISALMVTEKGADFSPCRKWRYALWREWGPCDPSRRVAFIGLNPSTADESIDDPTIRRCIGFAKSWGYSGLVMLNAYAFRATDPKDMKKAADPIGPDNDAKLAEYSEWCAAYVAAWGAHCSPSRARSVCEVIGHRIQCLGKTKDGHPKHPLYLASNTRLQPFYPSHPQGERGE
jgi:hypothetical protein